MIAVDEGVRMMLWLVESVTGTNRNILPRVAGLAATVGIVVRGVLSQLIIQS